MLPKLVVRWELAKSGRGQNDKADAKNIALYAYRHQDRLGQRHRIYQPTSPTFSKLKAMLKYRDKLLKIKLQLNNEVGEYKSMALASDENSSTEMQAIAEMKEAINEKIVIEIEKSIKQCESHLKILVKEDQRIKQRFDLITTVEGVSLLSGVYFIVATNNFKSITSSRKLACHIGIAPFQKVSGCSIKVNKGVSHFCDKLGKKMITNSTGCAIRRYGGLSPDSYRDYYERKLAEGVPEGRVLNACKNKLLHRIFAVVKSGKPYDKFHEWQPNTKKNKARA